MLEGRLGHWIGFLELVRPPIVASNSRYSLGCRTLYSSVPLQGAAIRNSSLMTPKGSRSSMVSTRPTPGKFSNDTERLQIINSIPKAPVGARIKKVLDALFKYRQAFTPEQIYELTFVDVNVKEVFDSLKNNLKVHYDGERFSYKAKHGVKDKSQLLQLIRKYVEGIAVVELKDAYPQVMEDIQALKAAGHIWLLSNFDSQEDIAYPSDAKAVIKVDDDLKQSFRSIELPRDMLDIEKDLQKNGMKPATNTAQRRAATQVQGISNKTKIKKKTRDINKRTKLTNMHMPELFRN